MKKVLIPLVIVVGLVWYIFTAISGFYNMAMNHQENAKTSWANVESSYQRRADLIPNLVSTVKGYAAHEKETLEGVIKARSEATKTTIDASKLTTENMAQFQKAQQGLSGALSRLLVTVEKYPDLKANKNFLELQSQLEGTENRINVSRDRFNEKANTYNKHIKSFVGRFVASYYDFKEMALFKADAASKDAPKVEF